MPEIKYCPGTLAEGYNTYSKTCLNKLFSGKKVSHQLPYNSPLSEEDSGMFLENRKRISISGVQEKFSFILDKNKLRLTEKGEQGNYIVKPIPGDLQRVDEVPANEHLTMQIARQVYSISTAENALIFFANGEPAYITKRFDVKDDGLKMGKEDFASLAGKTSENAGPDFKYKYSYEQLAELLINFVPAHKVEIEKLYRIIVFNYLFSNGDAHLKNFSLLETHQGDFVLSPAYDLLNTRIHVKDTDFALEEGLFQDGFESDEMKINGWVGIADFYELAKRLHITEARRDKLLKPFLARQEKVEIFIQRSFLKDSGKKLYLQYYKNRLKRLNAIS